MHVYVHPKNSNPIRSHSRAIMALDHSRISLENKFLENNSGRIFCFRQVYFTKSCQQIWGCVIQLFILLYITSEVKQYYLSYRPRTDRVSFSFVKKHFKGNKGRRKELTIRGHRKKSEPQMGFEPTTLRVLDRML